MKVFISHPMSGRSMEEILDERTRIKQKCQQIFKTDIEIVGFVDGEDPDYIPSRVYCLGRSITYMCQADLIFFAHDWETAKGCQVEFDVAKNYGLNIYMV